MTFEADFRSHVISQAGVGERIYPLIRKGESLPAITYQRIIGVGQTNLDGDIGGLENIRFQVDVWASTYDAARAVANAVKTRMQTAASTFTSVIVADQDLYEDDTRLARVSLDFSCWYRTT